MNLRDFFVVTTWWGKILGAFFGYLTGGPLGAFFGILVGNFFDRGLISYYSNPHWLYHAEKQKAVQKAFFETTFSIMGHIAKSDGRVSEQEIKMAKLLMNEMKLSKAQKDLAKRLFNEGKQPHFNVSFALTQLQTICRDNRELLKLFVDIQYRAAQVDGLSTQKIQALDNIFSHLGFAPLHKQYRFYEDFGYYYQQHKQAYQHQQRDQHSSSSKEQYYYKPQYQPNALEHAFALLEVSPNANKQDVRRAYRRLLSRNHPDKLIAQGLPEEMIKLANDKTHNIMKAYELICETKGW